MPWVEDERSGSVTDDPALVEETLDALTFGLALVAYWAAWARYLARLGVGAARLPWGAEGEPDPLEPLEELTPRRPHAPTSFASLGG